MSIVTFWNDDREQTGKTMTTVAVASRMATERNLKILLVSTSYRDDSIKNCFWYDSPLKSSKLFSKGNNIAVESGIEGLSKLIKANKIQPSIITDYTKVILKGRLEILDCYRGSSDNTEEERIKDYYRTAESYPELLRIANQYYDMVLVDVDNRLPQNIKQEILQTANLNMMVMTQRKTGLDKYNELKSINPEINGPRCLPVIGKYNRNSKYNKKNVTRYLDEKKEVCAVPFNTLFFEAAEEVEVMDFFMKYRTLKDTSDYNYIFMDEVLKLVNNIINRLQELQMKMR